MNAEPLTNVGAERLVRAIRFTFASLVVALSYLPVRAALMVPGFEQTYHDLLGGRELPALTVFVLRTRYVLLAISLLLPLVAVGTLFSRHLTASFYLLGVLCILTFALFLVMSQGLSAPLFQVIQQMQGG